MARPNVPDLRTRLAWLKEGDVHGSPSFHLERQQIRCGKAGCRCLQGKRHGPFYYLRLRDARDRRRHRVYVPQGKLRTIKRWIKDFRKARESMNLALRMVHRWYR